MAKQIVEELRSMSVLPLTAEELEDMRGKAHRKKYARQIKMMEGMNRKRQQNKDNESNTISN